MIVTSRERRVWMITECYPRPRAPGHCIFAHRQTVGLRQSGWDVSVLLPNGWYPPFLWPIANRWRKARAESVPATWTPGGIRVRDLVYANPIPSRLSGAANHGEALIRSLGEQVREAAHPPSVLLVQFALPLGPVVRDVANRMAIPYAVYLRGDDVWIWPHDHPRRMASFIDVVGDAALVLGVSRAILAEARRISGLRLDRAVVLPNGVDLNAFRPATPSEREGWRNQLGIGRSAFVVVCVASALRRKGWVELLEALGQLSGGEVVLFAATIGLSDLDLDAECAQRAPAVRLVRRHGVTAAFLAPLYGAADVFCLPSHGEGMSNALLEAMACGIPVVTTPVGGHPEVVTDGVEGRLVPVRSVGDVRLALEAFARDPDARLRAGRAGRRRAETIGTPDDAGSRLGELLSAVIDRTLPDVLLSANAYGRAEATA